MVFFTFSINFFYENINQEHNLGIPNCVLGPFTYVCCRNYMSGFSAFVLNLSKSDNILFRKMANGIYLFSSAWFVIDRRDKTLVDGSCWATCKCNILHPISCTEISLWKRPISTVMPGKLFSSYVLIRQRCSRDSTTSELNCFYESMKHYILHHYHQF